MMLRSGLCGLALVVSVAYASETTTAQTGQQLNPFEAANVLRRINTAARNLNYSGVYLYQQADHLESLRLVHYADGNGEQEKRESLDGPPREFIRNNDQIVCYRPDTKPIALDRRTANKFFPGIIPDQIADVVANYNLRQLENERVAGYETQVLILEPRDKLRHPHKLWIEPSSGLLLKTSMLNSQKAGIVEQFTFTQLQIGGSIDKRALRPSIGGRASLAELAQPKADQAPDSNWEVRNVPTGFRLIKEVRRQLPGKSQPVVQYVYSDGLATVSVFIEPLAAGATSGQAKQGSLNVYARQSSGYQITALGEVPEQTVQMFTHAFILR
ncbi:MucB/RseB C-terminal domain-containing protein [Parachitinimonas caeni]|uniref:MucB/RseB C-terminal domain-containing protein n=1 Tax=Parachitinimonas caeni TaxID=3031301 RepID=A0ABT7DW10_9NEIS|nr:MucB/RseB C-terminal domain-containing protein [Parachitinimonas caeni]MDK2124230.1 MucB/RseB C-terminal domain-containing protein [Parachitinimonas caeni]